MNQKNLRELIAYKFFCLPEEAEKIKAILTKKNLPDNGDGVKDLLLAPEPKSESAIADYIKNNPEAVMAALGALDGVKNAGAKILVNFLKKKVGM